MGIYTLIKHYKLISYIMGGGKTAPINSRTYH